MASIVAISVPYPGVCRVLEEGEKVGLWKFIQLTNERDVDIPASADLYILGAWHAVYSEILDVLRLQGPKRVIVLWTSSAGEVGLEPSEQQVLDNVLVDERVDTVWFADKALAEAFPKDGFYAPYPLSVPVDPPSRNRASGQYMTLFCPSTLKKNIFTQLVAAVLVQQERPEMVLYTNVTVPNVFNGVLRFKETGWLPQNQYHELMQSSILNFACSFAETFNYQAAEAALLWRVPSVCSYTVPWAPSSPLWRVRNPNNAQEIATKALRVMDCGEHFQRAAIRWAKRSNPALKAALAKLTPASP